MFRKMIRPTLLAATVAAVGVAQADESAVKKGMEAFVGAPVVESVRKTDHAGLYEVVLRSGELIYTDEDVGFIIDGRIIDTETRRDITQERRNELSAIDFDSLPLEHAIKQVRGDGSRVIASFEDPNCGYCKRLGQELATLDDITIYTFLYPILSEDSVQKSRNIWCAEDQAAAWNDWILDNETPPAESCDSSAVDASLALGQQLRIQGTPTIFLSDGQRLGGYVPAAQLEAAMARAAE